MSKVAGRDVKVLSMSQYCDDKNVSISSRTYDGFKRQVFQARSVSFSLEGAEARTAVTTGPFTPITPRVPFAYTDLVVE